MKFMKLGSRPDTFFTEDATRTVMSDVPSDLTIRVNNTTYLLHKFPLLPKCGLLQRLCSDSGNPTAESLDLHDIPGGEDAFELCAKFCYGITINLSAENLVPALCAAKFLRMTEAIDKGNFATKLEAFFTSCILEGWKDSITTLDKTTMLPEWSESLGIIRKCIDSIVEKILTPPSKVTWSFTYSRTGYDRKRHPVPKDWWTEDIANLDIDMFRCIITALRSVSILPPQLIGEALHVYACKWLPDTRKIRPPPETSASSHSAESAENRRRILETIVGMIPGEMGSVSVGFLLRLLNTGIVLGVSPVTKAELIRRSGLQLEEATLSDLVIPANASSSDHHSYDVDMVGVVLESFLRMWRSPFSPGEDSQLVKSVRKVAKLIDSYLQIVAKDVNMPVQKMVSLAEAVPQFARTDHDELYKAINTYLKDHPDLNKADRKQLCRILDCQKLSPETRAHAIRNERLPLRTVVQILFFEQERATKTKPHHLPSHEQLKTRQQAPVPGADQRRLELPTDELSSNTEAMKRSTLPGSSVGTQTKSNQMPRQRPETSARGKEIAETAIEKRGEGKERGNESRNIMQRQAGSEHSHDKVGDR